MMIRRPSISVTTPTPSPAASAPSPAASPAAPAPTTPAPTTPAPISNEAESSNTESNGSSSSSINYESKSSNTTDSSGATPTSSSSKGIDFSNISAAEVRSEVASILSGMTTQVETDSGSTTQPYTAPSVATDTSNNGNFADFDSHFTNLDRTNNDPYASLGTVGTGTSTDFPSFARDDSSSSIDTTKPPEGVLVKNADGSVDIVNPMAAKLMGNATKQAYSDMVGSVLDYARSKGVSNPEAVTNAILTNEKLLSQDYITSAQSQDLVSRLPDLVDALSATIEAPKYYSPEHLQQLTQDSSLNESASVDATGAISAQETAQLQQLEKMYEQFAAIKDDPRLAKELDDRMPGFVKGQIQNLGNIATSAIGMAKYIPMASIAVAAMNAWAADERSAELTSFEKSGMIENPLASAMTEYIEQHNRKDVVTNTVGAGMKLGFGELSQFILPSVEHIVDAAANGIAGLMGNQATDFMHDQLAGLVGEQALDSGIQTAEEAVAKGGTKAGVKQGATAGLSKAAHKETSDLAKQLRIDPDNAKTNFGDYRVGEALMSYLIPGADNDLLSDPSSHDMENTRLALRQDLFGLSPDQEATPISTNDAKALRKHIDLLFNAEDDDGMPLLDSQQYADGIQERRLDPLSMIAGSDKGAQPKPEDINFFRDFRGDSMF